MSPSHNGNSQLADSNTGEENDEWIHYGLSDLGKQAVVEMNTWGIMIDVSHPSKKAMMDMLAVTQAPIIASHSAARALCDHSRNLDDEQLLALKENGGVVQAVAFGSYVNAEKTNARRKATKPIYEDFAAEMGIEWLEWSEARKLSPEKRKEYWGHVRKIRELAKDRIKAEVDAVAPPVNVADYVDHIDYMVDLIGLEHVGISSDFDGGGGVEGWDHAGETFNVTLELVRRGYTEVEIGMIWSGNLLRVLEEVEGVAGG